MDKKIDVETMDGILASLYYARDYMIDAEYQHAQAGDPLDYTADTKIHAISDLLLLLQA